MLLDKIRSAREEKWGAVTERLWDKLLFLSLCAFPLQKYQQLAWWSFEEWCFPVHVIIVSPQNMSWSSTNQSAYILITTLPEKSININFSHEVTPQRICSFQRRFTDFRLFLERSVFLSFFISFILPLFFKTGQRKAISCWKILRKSHMLPGLADEWWISLRLWWFFSMKVSEGRVRRLFSFRSGRLWFLGIYAFKIISLILYIVEKFSSFNWP